MYAIFKGSVGYSGRTADLLLYLELSNIIFPIYHLVIYYGVPSDCG